MEYPFFKGVRGSRCSKHNIEAYTYRNYISCMSSGIGSHHTRNPTRKHRASVRKARLMVALGITLQVPVGISRSGG